MKKKGNYEDTVKNLLFDIEGEITKKMLQRKRNKHKRIEKEWKKRKRVKGKTKRKKKGEYGH